MNLRRLLRLGSGFFLSAITGVLAIVFVIRLSHGLLTNDRALGLLLWTVLQALMSGIACLIDAWRAVKRTDSVLGVGCCTGIALCVYALVASLSQANYLRFPC